MTLCIAAACKEGEASRIVLCTDEMVSTEVSSSETEFKLVHLPRFIGMFSGFTSDARELLSIYEKYLSDQRSNNGLSNLSAHEWLEKFRAPIRVRKKAHIEHLLAGHGLTFKEYADRSDKLGDLRKEVWQEAENRAFEVELLMTGFTEEKSQALSASHLICRVIRGDAEVHTNFACIGAGREAAEQSLHRREQDSYVQLAQTLYHVYEAKRMGEQSPRVGKRTTLAVMGPRIDEKDLTDYRLGIVRMEGMQLLENYYRQYGPKPTRDLSIPSDFKLYI